MTRRELLNQLIKRYSVEKSRAIIRLATEDGYYENKEVHVAVAEDLDGIRFFSMHWKEN